MSISTVVTRGYGSGATIAFVTTRGYDIGAAIIPIDPALWAPQDKEVNLWSNQAESSNIWSNQSIIALGDDKYSELTTQTYDEAQSTYDSILWTILPKEIN